MYADMGVKNAAETAERLDGRLKELDFYYHVGDISYANDYHSEDFEKIWNDWFVLMKDVLPFAPYMVAVGNHEHESGEPHLKYTEFFRVYNYRFKMPANADNNMCYSFDYNGVHFISISTETDYPEAPFASNFGPQLEWLKADLEKASANRKNVPWIVASGHRPLYTSTGHPEYQKFLRHAFEDMFHQHHVDLYVCGHVHNYERSYPVFNGSRTSASYVDPSSTVHVVIGNAGCPEGISHHFDPVKPEWSAYRYDNGTGYGLLTVDGATSLKWEFFASRENKLHDTFTITKKAALFKY